MSVAFYPSPRDVARYVNLRAMSVRLNNKMVSAIPRQAFEEVAAPSVFSATGSWNSTVPT
jgi:hypothetical protein